MTTQITSARSIPVAQLRAHPGNVRRQFGDLTELARSLRVQGCLQALLVAPRTVRGEQVFVVIDGERRLRAARQAQIPALPCLVTTEMSPAETVETMLAAGMHERVDPMDQARAFRDLVDHGVSVDTIAGRTGYTAKTVRGRIALLELPPEAQEMVARKEITLGAARDLAEDARRQRQRDTAQAENSRKGAIVAASKQAWFTRTHRHAAAAKASCTADHRATRVLVGGIACGQCWEKALAGGPVATRVEALLDAEVTQDIEAHVRRDVGDVRCLDCGLRYEERQEYGCHEEGRGHSYEAGDLADAEKSAREEPVEFVTLAVADLRAALAGGKA